MVSEVKVKKSHMRQTKKEKSRKCTHKSHIQRKKMVTEKGMTQAIMQEAIKATKAATMAVR